MAKQTRSDREAVRQRLAEERARQAAVDRRRRNVFVAVGVVVVGAIVAMIAVAIVAADSDLDSATGPTPPAATADNGGLVTGPTAAKAAADGIPTVDVYADFQCPACATFEEISGPTLEQLAEEGKARVVYHSINLIGRQLSGEIPVTSSLRAAGAFGCASDESDDFLEFQRVAFANQTSEGQGITDDQLIAWGTQSGIMTAAFERCVRDETYFDWAKRVDAESRDRGITSTPTVLVDGRELTRQPNEYTPEGLTAAVAAATS